MEKAIQGIIDLLNLLITHYGQTGTLLIALFILVVIGVWRWYNDWKSEQRINQLLKEKDITIQRLAKSEREWKILYYKEVLKWSDKQIEQFFIKNEFQNPVDARKEMEKGNFDSKSSSNPTPITKAKKMTGFELLILIMVSYALKDFVLGIASFRRSQKYHHLLIVEQTQAQFATVRQRLMHLATEKKIDANSQTFKVIYHLCTSIMRRPEQYPQISAVMREVLSSLNITQSHNPIYFESRSWSEETVDLIKELSKALGFFMIDYSRFWKIVFKVLNFFRPNLTPVEIFSAMAITKSDKEKVAMMKDAEETRREFIRLVRTSQSKELALHI
jgi:hypothetical protein